LQFNIDTPMAITASKLIAAAIALGYFVTSAIVAKPGVGESIMLFLVLLVPVALIWFPQMGSSWPRKKTVLYTYEDSFGARSGPGAIRIPEWWRSWGGFSCSACRSSSISCGDRTRSNKPGR
jgi:hypothetical protein